ncbi:hypothetical protein [Sulfuricurvum sp.]|uniref:hypothetical protein n=1 Tax=Sulfuricurvum sp. TaxID=2025608 RepID=UPI002E321B88|nr:hypothetical protein [Sulfuricurvum sp.]HEX5330012.1 hypothetical protein [Sulfuricurvum sp.]
MENTPALSTFESINEDIKAVLRDLDERIAEHPSFKSQNTSDNDEAFLEILDKLLEALCIIKESQK